MAYVTSADDLVTEFQRRRIDARLGLGSTCLADVNNVAAGGIAGQSSLFQTSRVTCSNCVAAAKLKKPSASCASTSCRRRKR